MARVSEGIPNLRLRGRVGQVVFVAGPDGSTGVRQRPTDLPPRTALQEEVADRMRTVAAAWQALSFEEADAWAAYVQNPHPALPQGGGGTPKTAYNAFSGLAIKCLQMRPGSPVPTFPPTSAFLGDGLVVTIDSPSSKWLVLEEGAGGGGKRVPDLSPLPPLPNEPSGEGAIRFSPSAPNTPGVLTEILVQKLAGKHRKPVPKAYRTAAFVAFTNEPFDLPVEPGVYACAIRFVREATGQETQIVPIGKVAVSAGT